MHKYLSKHTIKGLSLYTSFLQTFHQDVRKPCEIDEDLLSTLQQSEILCF